MFIKSADGWVDLKLGMMIIQGLIALHQKFFIAIATYLEGVNISTPNLHKVSTPATSYKRGPGVTVAVRKEERN